MNNFLRNAVAIIFSVALLSGCGWHLRGTNIALDNVQSVHISGRNLRTELVETLQRNLEAIDIVTTVSAAEAQYSLVILDQRSSRRTATVSASARVAEYRLTETVDLLILDIEGTQLLPRTTLSVERVFEFDENNVHASDDEAELLRSEMRNNLSRQIIDRLRGVSHQSTVQQAPAAGTAAGTAAENAPQN